MRFIYPCQIKLIRTILRNRYITSKIFIKHDRIIPDGERIIVLVWQFNDNCQIKKQA